MIGDSRFREIQLLAAAVAAASGSRVIVMGSKREAPPLPHTDPFGDGGRIIEPIGAPAPAMVARVKRWLNDDPRRAGAGKPWKRGGRHTIKQRRALAFAARRRS